MNYENLLIEADNQNIITKELPLISYDGLIKDNYIAIRKDLTTTEKACVMAEELGHYHTSTCDILLQDDVQNRKQEQQGRIWAYDKQIGLYGIISAYKANCKSCYDAAEYLGVSEKFLKETISYYRQKYGIATKLDNYIIGFEPNLYVIELLE